MGERGRRRIRSVGRLAVCALSSLLLSGSPLSGQSLCEGDDYRQGLCAYRAGDHARAAALFQRVLDADEPRPETIKARYFLARALMKQHKWNEASNEFIKIYGLSRAFYDEWNCDFLLGECRRAQGKG